MRQKIVYVTPDLVCHPSAVDNSVQMLQLDSDVGKVLVNQSYENEYLRKIVDSADGWTEIDTPIDDDTEATESDYIDALNELGVEVE